MGKVNYGADYIKLEDGTEEWTPYINIEIDVEEDKTMNVTFESDICYGEKEDVYAFLKYVHEALSGKMGVKDFVDEPEGVTVEDFNEKGNAQ